MFTEDLVFSGTHYFVWVGLLYLGLMTFQDLRHKMNVDDRRNWFMSGVAISLLSHISMDWWALLGLVIFNIVFRLILKKFKVFGDADLNSLLWINSGFGILSFGWLAVWLIVFLCFSLIYYAYRLMSRIVEPTPFYPVLFLSFLATSLLVSAF